MELSQEVLDALEEAQKEFQKEIEDYPDDPVPRDAYIEMVTKHHDVVQKIVFELMDIESPEAEILLDNNSEHLAFAVTGLTKEERDKILKEEGFDTSKEFYALDTEEK